MPSSDEGEIVEGGSRHLKATSPARADGSRVDRRDRHLSRNSTPDLDYGSRNAASPRGNKRARDDRDYHGRARDEARSSRGRYDDWSRLNYDDDRPSGRDARDRDWDRQRDRYDDRSEKRPRHRSRSPRRPQDRTTDRFVREREHHDSRSSRLSYDDRRETSKNAASDKPVREASQNGSHDAKVSQGSNVRGEIGSTQKKYVRSGQGNGETATDIQIRGVQFDLPAAEPEPQEDYEEPEPIDEEAEIERRRKRREELLAKANTANPLLLHAVGATDKVRGTSATPQPETPLDSGVDSTPQTPRTPLSGLGLGSPRSPRSLDGGSPGGLNLASDHSLMKTNSGAAGDEEDGPSAADYDPTMDMREDERRDELRHGQVVLHGEAHVIETTEKEPAEDKPKAQENEDDDDDDFDMFADDFDEEKYANKPSNAVEPIETKGNDTAPDVNKGGIIEGDDKDGYYKIRVGEILNGRYQIQTTLGRGMFSGVVRATDVTTKRPVAIKIMRANDALRKGGFTEIAILEKLNGADPENRKHIVKFERQFDYKGHLCMVFENLSLNLREVLRKFGNNVGINLAACRTYAHQIFVALAHMRKCSIIHADLKPDNILVNETRSVLKICDLGTAIDRSDAATAHTQITPYLVSRFYRAPEIILGMPYDYSVDMWSIGCTLYELYTGKILFTGDSNNQMIKTIMEIRGRLTPKLYKRGQLAGDHFDEQGQFLSMERDKVLNKTTVRTLPVVKPTRDLRTRITAASSAGMSDAESRELNQFIDLLEHCLTLNPDKRIKPADALRHPFFTARSAGPKR